MIVESDRFARRFLKDAFPNENPQSKQSFLLNEHTTPEDLVDLIQWFKSDSDIALLSDAGAPAVADPGAAAVRMAHNAGWSVKPHAGPSSILLALMASGMNGQQFAFKGYLECNWLQVVEVGIDPSHASYLHRYLDENEIDYGLQFGGTSGDSDLSVTSVLRNFDRPEINVVPEDFGLRIITTREINPETMHVRVTNMVFPNAVTIPMTKDMCITQWHVPIDDTHSWWYCIFTDFHNEVDKETMREQRLELYTLPDYKPRINMRNDYGYDPEEQRNETYTGMGRDINVHDQWAVESAGPIFDRSQEHLGSADKAITAFRKLLLQSIEENQAGKTPPMVLNGAQADAFTGPMAIDTVASMTNWQDEWQAHDRTKRGKSPWANQNPI